MPRNLLLAILVALPLGLYIWKYAALYWQRRSGSRAPLEDYREFLNPWNALTPSAFANSSTAYNFQVASISFFVALGYFSPVAALVNIAFWGLGILLFSAAVSRLSVFFGSRGSLMTWLGDQYSHPGLRTVAGVLVFLAFTGLLLAELLFGSMIFTSIGFSHMTVIIMAFFFGFFILLYYLSAGMLSVVETDEKQVLISYVGVFAVIFWCVQAAASTTEENRAVVFAVTTGLFVVTAVGFTLLWREQRTRKTSSSPSDRVMKLVFAASSLVLAFLATQSFEPRFPSAFVPDAIDKFGEFNDLTYASAFILTPLFWQFGDATHWHRLGALRMGNPAAPALPVARSGIRRFAWQSAVTILLPVSVGVLLHYLPTPVTEEGAKAAVFTLAGTLFDGNTMQYLAGSLFVVAVAGIMLSTVDSLLATSVLVFIYDINNRSRTVVDSHREADELGSTAAFGDESRGILRSARFAAASIIMIGLLVYFILYVLNIDLFAWLFVGFSLPLSLAPAVLLAILVRKTALEGNVALVSILCGATCAIGMFVYSMFDDRWTYAPPIGALGASTLVLCVGIGVRAAIRRGKVR
ncbi:MAG: hypothetical protein PVI86_19325 [Phycisphaerae bacterium]|jgi:hypothetical protein